MPHLPIRHLLSDESGATALEYALLAALIGIAAVTAMSQLGDSVSTNYSNVDSAVGGVTP